MRSARERKKDSSSIMKNFFPFNYDALLFEKQLRILSLLICQGFFFWLMDIVTFCWRTYVVSVIDSFMNGASPNNHTLPFLLPTWVNLGSVQVLCQQRAGTKWRVHLLCIVLFFFVFLGGRFKYNYWIHLLIINSEKKLQLYIQFAAKSKECNQGRLVINTRIATLFQ